ncbi:MAG: serine protease [Microthrixaceae bacterium]|nr:serine protease [Microthrixaceae bacterium]
MLEELQETVGRLATEAGASVVSIGRNGRGSGFVVGPDRVLTSAHNLRDRTVAVTFADGRAEQGAVHGDDHDGDLVVLDVPTGEAPALALAELDADAPPAVGTAVVALSRGGHRPRATVGFVSGSDRAFRGPRGRVVRGAVEHTAPLARGSSGGPVLDADGRVVGVNTHRVGDGFYLARVSDPALRARVDELLAGRSVRRRLLGVAVAPPEVAGRLRRAVGLDDDRPGLLVRAVDDDGPAAAAGVSEGDLLVAAGDTALASVDDLAAALDDGDEVTLTVVRGADERTVTVSFSAPAPPGPAA